MNVRVQNLFHNFSFVQLNAANQVVGNNIGQNISIQVQWVDSAKGTAHLYVPAKGMFITVNGANEVVGSANAQLLQLVVQGNGSYVIHAASDTTRRLVLDKLSGPITNAPEPRQGAADFNKQYWMLISPK